MDENNIPNPPALGQDLDYDGDAAYRTYLNSVAPPVPPGQLQEFCPAEIPMRETLLRGDSALMKTFLSRGFLLSSISVTALPIQIVQLIRAVSTFFHLEPDWLNLPANWLTSDQMLFVQSTQFSIYVTLRMEITAGSDGDGIHEFELEPADVESQSQLIYPACSTIAGLVSPTAARSQSQSVFIQFLPLFWNAARRMETVLVRNFPFDNFGSHTKLLLHLLAEYFDSCLRKHGQEELEYYIVITPALIGKSKTNEGIARAGLPPTNTSRTKHGSSFDLLQCGGTLLHSTSHHIIWMDSTSNGRQHWGSSTSRLPCSVWYRHPPGNVYHRSFPGDAASGGSGVAMGGRKLVLHLL